LPAKPKERAVELPFQPDPDDVSTVELLERILDKGIVLEPWARIMLAMNDSRMTNSRIVVAPERRCQPFVVPINRRG